MMKIKVQGLTKKLGLTWVLAGLVSQVAQAAFTTNDLYLGFTLATAQSDYIIDLGQPKAVGVRGQRSLTLARTSRLAHSTQSSLAEPMESSWP